MPAKVRKCADRGGGAVVRRELDVVDGADVRRYSTEGLLVEVENVVVMATWAALASTHARSLPAVRAAW